MAGIELNQYINVAVRPEIITQGRAEHREPLNVMFAAEGGNCPPVYWDPGHIFWLEGN